MLNTFAARLMIDPMPTPRPRFRAIPVRGKTIVNTYHPKEYTEYQKMLELLIDDAAPANFDGFDGRLRVTIQILVTKPKTTKLPAPKPDVDNYAKGVLDAATKAGLWHDDSQVVELHVAKAWATDGVSCIHLRVEQE